MLGSVPGDDGYMPGAERIDPTIRFLEFDQGKGNGLWPAALPLSIGRVGLMNSLLL